MGGGFEGGVVTFRPDGFVVCLGLGKAGVFLRVREGGFVGGVCRSFSKSATGVLGGVGVDVEIAGESGGGGALGS